MKTTLAFIAAVALAAPAASALADSPYPINPGTWEVRTLFLGLVGGSERWCVKPQDISKFLSGPSNHIYHCTYPVNTAGDGALHFDGACVDKKGQEIKLRGHGDYTPTTLHMTAEGSTQYMGIPISGDATVVGHFLSEECPEGAKAFK